MAKQSHEQFVRKKDSYVPLVNAAIFIDFVYIGLLVFVGFVFVCPILLLQSQSLTWATAGTASTWIFSLFLV